MRFIGRRVTSSILAVLALSIWFLQAGAANAADNLDAFRNFVKAADYKNANFYIDNKLIDPKTLDTSQIFYDALSQSYFTDLNANAAKIDALYTYLNTLNAVDLNRKMTCGNQGQNFCLLADDLLSGASPAAIDYFTERGLDLNQRVAGLVPATVPLVVRLGTVYSLDDLNHFVGRGLVLGDETYPINELVNYTDNSLYDRKHGGNRLTMPDNYLSLRDQNLLDVLVIALGSGSSNQTPALMSAHRAVLCGFIAYAAPSFTPSFDYLTYILDAVPDFRGKAIGTQAEYNRQIYQPFPNACVAIVEGMAGSHAAIDAVISRFAGAGDVETANWLISIRQRDTAAAKAGK